MSQLEIRPLRKLEAEFSVPGDKSISHRGIMFGVSPTAPPASADFFPGRTASPRSMPSRP